MTALFVLGTIVVFLLVDWAVTALRDRKAKPEGAAGEPVFWDSPELLRPSRGSFFAPGHTWARLRPDGSVLIGIDAFAHHAVGSPISFDLPESGRKIRKGESLLSVKRGGRELAFQSPLTGCVAAYNPSPYPSDPDEWLVRLEPARLGVELKALRLAEETRRWLAREAARFRDFLMDGLHAATATLPDGGLPTTGVLSLLSDEMWAAFEDEFLTEEES